MNGLAREYRNQLVVRFYDIENRANRRLVAEYGASAIPYIVIFNDRGEVSSVFRGVTNARVLRRAIDRALAESSAR